MEKAALEELLTANGVRPTLPPIEECLHIVATQPQLPDSAITMCALRMEEAGPALRAVLIKAASGAALSEDESQLVFRGLYLLGGARDAQAFQPLLRLLHRPIEVLDVLLGDAITETLARIVIGVFDGDADTLFEAITDTTIDEFIRDALLGAATFLTWSGRIERDRMQRFLERFYWERLAGDGDHAWVAWLDSIALLGLRILRPAVLIAWDEGRIPDGILDRKHFEDDLAQAEQAPDDIERFKRANLGTIEDIVEALEWTRLGEDVATGKVSPSLLFDAPAWSSQPVRNPWRHVGRNDPCPCGSGKKAKKCCLDR